MTNKTLEYKLTAHHIAAAESALAKGEKVELVPFNDGTVRVFHIKRKEIKTNC